MSIAKEEVIKLIKEMPKDISIEDIQYELYFKTKVEKELKDVEESNTLNEEQMYKEIKSWLN